VRITIPASLEELKGNDVILAAKIQSQLRAEFLLWLGKGYAATAVAPSKLGVDYILEPGKAL
jgi:hypothetical protein